MKRLIIPLIAILLFISAASAALVTGRPFGGGVGWNGIYTVGNAAPNTFSYITGITSGTAIGTATSPVTPQPSGLVSYSLSGTNAGEFSINSSTGVISANGSTPTCSSPTPITNINVVSTQTGAFGSPTTQAITITCQLNDMPTFIQGVVSSVQPYGVEAVNNVLVPLPQAVQAGDALVLEMYYLDGSTVTVSDSTNGTWPAPCVTVAGGSGNPDLGIWVFPNSGAVPAGNGSPVTVSFGTAEVPFAVRLLEINNIAASSPCGSSKLFVNGITQSGSNAIDPGSFTPDNNDSTGGNLIIAFVAADAGSSGAFSNAITSKWVPTSGYTLYEGDITVGPGGPGYNMATQTLVQATHAATDPVFTATGYNNTTDQFSVVALSLKIGAGGGSIPSGIWIRKIIHQTTDTGTASAPTYLQLPSVGTYSVLASTSVTTDTSFTTVQDNSSNTWTQNWGGATEGPPFWILANQSANPGQVAKVNYSGTSNTQYSLRYFDIQNEADTTGTPDSSVFSGFSASCNATFTNLFSLAPTTANGLILSQIGMGTGPGQTVTSPSGANFLLLTYTGQTDTSPIDNADWVIDYFNPNTSSVSFSGTTGVNTSCAYGAIAIH